MRSYLVTSGGIFFLILVAHAVRLASEGAGLALEPSFAASSVVTICMCLWACWLFRQNA